MSATAPKTNGRVRAPRVVPAPPETQPQKGSPLMAAILAVQADAPKLGPNADGQAGGRTYRYVTLDAVVDAVLPLLVKHELAWTTFPTSDEHGQPALRYRITHLPSGEAEEDVMALMCVKADPQGQGSALTYARRYALVAVLNLTTGDDDDGAHASSAKAYDPPPVIPPIDSPEHDPPRRTQPSARPAAPSERPATAKQRSLIEVRAREAKLEPGDLANVLKQAGGADPITWADPAAAERWAGRALDRLPAKLVDAVLAGIAESNGAGEGGA